LTTATIAKRRWKTMVKAAFIEVLEEYKDLM